MTITDDQIRKLGYEHFHNHNDYFIAVLPMTFGKGRIIYAENEHGIINAWCYTHYADAIIAMIQWDVSDDKEPSGWIRNPIDGRRRPDGDSTNEYIHY